MKAQLRSVTDAKGTYTAIAFVCPGCQELYGRSGLHMLAVNSPDNQPSWDWDGNLDYPTLSPSILTGSGSKVCHSFLKNGIFEFLGDCTHSMAGQNVPMPHLPNWFTKEYDNVD